MASLKRGASYLPVSTSDLVGSAWEARARSDFMAKVTSLVFVQALVACAAALAPTLSTGVRDFVLSHAAMAYIALFAPLVLILCGFCVATVLRCVLTARARGAASCSRCGTRTRGTTSS